jgi:uncharacterized protein (TIGR03083 family)
MALQSVEDARRLARLSADAYTSLRDYLEQLPPAGRTEQSAAREWKVYQVVSHLGSQAEIQLGTVNSALRDAPPLGDPERKAIWGYFDSLQPDQVLAPFIKNNDSFIAFVEGLSEAELGRSIPWLSGTAPIAQVLATRLGEQALHTWDIRWARDRDVRLAPETVPDLLELHIASGRLKLLAKPEQAGALAGKTAQFFVEAPATSLALKVGSESVEAFRGRVAHPDFSVELPAEVFLRLIWGRFLSPDGEPQGQVKLSRPELLPSLVALYPGR